MVVVLSGSGALRTRDAMRTWERFGDAILENDQQIREVRYSPEYQTDHRIFLSTAYRLHASSDDGLTWQDINVNAMRYEEYSQTIYFIGGWSSNEHPDASASYVFTSRSARDEAVFLFNSTSVTWIGTRGPSMGIARIQLDNQHLDPYDCYAPQLDVSAPLLTLNDLPPGPHRLKITVSGNSNPESNGNWIGIDAFDVVP